MTALGGWLKQLVFIVLFAVFAEMLLPTRSLERYIRMVLGLALIATMLQPLGLLLQRNWAAEVASEAMSELTKATTTVQGSNVIAEGSDQGVEKLKQDLQTQQLQETDSLLAEDIQDGLVKKFGIRGTSVSVTGSATAGTLRVHVELSGSQMSRASPIQSWISSELGINKPDVVVDSGGGG